MKNESWSLALKVMANISGWIAFPVIIGLFLGRWLDRRFGTEPWLFLTTIGACFIISIYGLVINSLKEFKKIEKDYAAEKAEKLAAEATEKK
ncbi:MAG: AtpZ/AtpI family protein [Patescibacteria group bacterium]|jgi:F0F1-type ATP synthase assembly protein I